ncbi:hypothetical protein [Wandonia haliotis]|uniref:hypothetical protein n=1 Tax=Wandonia haliotis TaxID=574963 RepID=UPI0031DDD3DC
MLEFDASVKEALEEISERELHSANFETEDFVDLMELVYIKVMSTRSAYKLERFRNILVNQIVEPNQENNMSLKFVHLVEQLDDVQIIMLHDFLNHEGKEIPSLGALYSDGEDSPNQIHQFISIKVNRPVTLSELEFYLNELLSIGLIHNKSFIFTALGGSSTVNNYQISPIGKSFLEFIKLYC